MKKIALTAALLSATLSPVAFAQSGATTNGTSPTTTTPRAVQPGMAVPVTPGATGMTGMTAAPAGTPPAATAPFRVPGTSATTATPGAQTPAATVNQTNGTTSSPSASAVQTNGTTSRTAAAPVPGRNSFTMGEANRRITAAGFADVKGLKKDAHGIWRGTATKDGAATPVALDYQGNVVGK